MLGEKQTVFLVVTGNKSTLIQLGFMNRECRAGLFLFLFLFFFSPFVAVRYQPCFQQLSPKAQHNFN